MTMSTAEAVQDVTAVPAEPIYTIACSKGGVGKSMLSRIILDLLVERGEKVLFFETDTSNPDVYRSLERDPDEAPGEAISGIVMQTVKLDTANGWVDMVNAMGEHPDHVVVINTAARTNTAITSYGKTLRRMLPELGRELITLWVINRQRDAMDQLEEYLEIFGDCTTHVVRNGHFGDEAQFELYNGSKLRARIERAGGQSLLLPGLADRVADALYSQNLPISRALREMPIGNRGELMRWREEAKQVLQSVWAQ